ncbi:MAG: phenylalanine--tRNA ligase subunit beta [Candidatus Levybacteria bacterium]|nr:phenylalanine--tRNA ligase subunit beta [Candidatus Levybacteria bacterium]
MNIKILDSWLRERVKTKATPQKIAEVLSLTSVSVEKIERFETDYIYDIEVTTNRPDLMSVVGLAREAATVLPKFKIPATFIPLKVSQVKQKPGIILPIHIKNDPSLVNRICAAVMEVNLKDSPKIIKNRLEASGIRSLNNLVDVTNFVMRETGHPVHVFDYDRLITHTLIIRESKKGEKVTTLDGKTHILQGGDIVADNGKGEIVDLLGVIGTANSAVTNKTKRILLFIDNNDSHRIRKTSMFLAIRTEAAVLNEKDIDTELAMTALLKGIELYKKIADAKLASNIVDIYPNKIKTNIISISLEKIDKVIGIKVPATTSIQILNSLGFETKIENYSLTTKVPSWRTKDVTIEEDIIEEIARVFGYQLLPSITPPLTGVENYSLEHNEFYWEKRIKNALKYWGFIEVYTYSMVSEQLLEGPIGKAVELSNPLTEDMTYMRTTLVPSLLQVLKDNKNREEIKIFEIANVYKKKENSLPKEELIIAGVIQKEHVSFLEVKGTIEQLLTDLGIKSLNFKKRENGGAGAEIYIGDNNLGNIEILDQYIINFELNFQTILKFATLKKIYKPIPKFPPIIEDVRLLIDPKILYEEIISVIKKQSGLVVNVSLLDVFENKKTFRVTYQHPQKTLTNEEISKERVKIYSALKKELKVKIA